MNTSSSNKEIVVMTVNNQKFGIFITHIQDILPPQDIARVPLAPPEIAGCLNMRGRIITAIDMRKKLSLAPRIDKNAYIHVVIKNNEELYSLMFDSVGDALEISSENIENYPTTLDQNWKKLSVGIYQTDHSILVILDTHKLLDFEI